MVLATSETATTGVLSVLSYTTTTRGHMTAAEELDISWHSDKVNNFG